MHTQSVKTEFRKIRDFGDVLGVSFGFIRENFKPLTLGVLFIGGPFMLVGGAVMTLMVVRTSTMGTTSQGSSSFIAEFGISYFVNIMSLLAGAVMVVGVVNSYIRLYMASPDNKPKIQLNELWQDVKKDFFWLAGRLLLLTLLVFVYMAAVGGLAYLVFNSGIQSTGLKVFLGIIGFFGFLALTMYLAVPVYGLFPTQSYFERTGFAVSISRSFYLVKHQWWQSFAIIFVGGMVQGIVASVLYMPFYFILVIGGLFSTMQPGGGTPNTSLMTFAGVGMSIGLALGYSLSYIIHFVIQAFQYYNLLERKESTGLLDKIQSLGTVQATPAGAADFYGEEEKY